MMKNPVRLVNRVNFEKELQEKKLECEDMIRKYLPKEDILLLKSPPFFPALQRARHYATSCKGWVSWALYRA